MTTNRPQNSILVLATLGVYLGLVLAGATPQILAQAATTRIFDVKDEIEVREDLEKKPDDVNGPLISSIHTYFQNLDHYFKQVVEADEYAHSSYDPQDAIINGNYLGVYKQNPELVVAVPCYRVGDASRLYGISDASYYTTLPVLLNPSYNESNWSWAPMACVPYVGSKTNESAFTEIEVSGTQKGAFTYQLSIKLASSDEASTLFGNLQRAFNQIPSSDIREKQKVLWRNTKLTIVKNQVFVVTNLARADLEALLATNAK